ncbi:MAG: GIY-YIG nuclease family protein [Taibaiella sp.]|nr:GIY-YIG nuclease family protein [Taibaiella sp.]
MKTVEYAIVDIETTGGNASGSRITEVAILIHNGTEVVERFETLVNPEKDIPVPIFALTGISNEMVSGAPVFGDIAEQVYTLLQGRIFVAHNVNFDYSFIRHQLEDCGYQWTAKKLCTVRMARKIRPGLVSYSLGNLCHALDITIENRHRAGGDAAATAILFGKLLEWDGDHMIPEMVKRASGDQRLPPNLPHEDFEALPERPGVYYFRNQAGKVIYVGKAVNLKKRVAQHFSGHNVYPQRQGFLREIYGISFEVCATELMSLLLECIEIKRLWPVYNRALKRFEPKYGLLVYEAMNGYRYLSVGKINKHFQCIQVFNREYEAQQFLRHLSVAFGIDHRLCKLGNIQPAASPEPLPDPDLHNRLIEQALQYIEDQKESYFIMGQRQNTGREELYLGRKRTFVCDGGI